MQVGSPFKLVLVQLAFVASRVLFQVGFVASVGAKQTLASAPEPFLGAGAAAGADQRAHFGC